MLIAFFLNLQQKYEAAQLFSTLIMYFSSYKCRMLWIGDIFIISYLNVCVVLSLDSAGSWTLSCAAPSCWSPAADPAPCSSLSGTPGCSRPLGRNNAPYEGDWWAGGPSPPLHLSLRSSHTCSTGQKVSYKLKYTGLLVVIARICYSLTK